MLKRWQFIFLLAVTYMAVQNAAQTQGSIPRFQLLILRENWFDLGLGYDPEPALERLSAADYSNPLFTVTLDDIDGYVWDWQTITLTPDATRKLVQTVDEVEHPEGAQRLLDLEASMGWGDLLSRGLYIQPFVVLADGEFAYGGIFLDAISQMAINFPVIRISVNDEQAVMNILPIHIPFVDYDPILRAASLDDAFTPIIEGDRQSAPDFFDEAVSGWSSSEMAVHFRTVIMSDNVRSVIEESGKLDETPAQMP